jgi:hypothetical protein
MRDQDRSEIIADLSIGFVCYNGILGAFKIANVCAQASGWYDMAKLS